MLKQLDRQQSEALAKLIQARPKECYKNALSGRVALGDGDYVEGYIVIRGGLVIEHGWIETSDCIIDPTLYLDPPGGYFAGLRFDNPDKVMELTAGRLPAFFQFGWGGSDSPEMIDAQRAAWHSIGVDLNQLLKGGQRC